MGHQFYGSPPSPLGFDFPYPYAFTDLAKKAKLQVDAAERGNRIGNYRSASDLSSFWTVATNPRDAYLKCAYWLAIASQCVGSSALATTAKTFYDAGIGIHLLATLTPSEVYKLAARWVKSVGTSTPDLRAILALLGESSSETKIAGVKQAEWEASPTGIVAGTIKTSASDAAAAAETTKGLVTGKKPRGMSDLEWWFKKWGWRVGLGAVGAGALLWIGRPYLQALKSSPKVESTSG